MSKEAMKLALEALVKALPDMPVHTDWHLEAITALREALTSVPDWASEAKEQPAPATPLREQEPVAWMSDRAVGFKRSEFGATPTVPLYTSPQPAQPSKPWVGLTDEERNRIWSSYRVSFVAIEHIEAKLREKNT